MLPFYSATSHQSCWVYMIVNCERSALEGCQIPRFSSIQVTPIALQLSFPNISDKYLLRNAYEHSSVKLFRRRKMAMNGQEDLRDKNNSSRIAEDKGDENEDIRYLELGEKSQGSKNRYTSRLSHISPRGCARFDVYLSFTHLISELKIDTYKFKFKCHYTYQQLVQSSKFVILYFMRLCFIHNDLDILSESIIGTCIITLDIFLICIVSIIII